jgi:hypothetical protein
MHWSLVWIFFGFVFHALSNHEALKNKGDEAWEMERMILQTTKKKKK